MSNSQYVIEPREFRKNKSLVIFISVFAVVWGIGVGFGTRKVIIDFTFVGLLIFLLCMAIFILTLFILLNMNRRQTIIVEDENILVKSSSFPKTIRSIPKSNLASLLLEEAGAGPSLMFVYKIGKRSDVVPIAPFVNLEGKIYLQKKVATFLKQHNCEFQVVNKTKSKK